ncbi:MAG: helix-turn-helix transcriptional regulator [Clostridiales bacterium]|nr:helix-turn-helix transcriptional regulator [Clostridiales bacterium]
MDKAAMGARLKKARLKKGLTQEALAEAVNSGTTYISDIERGAKVPSMSFYVQLLNELDASSDFILQGQLNSGKTFIYNDLTQKLEQLTPEQRENVCTMIDAYIKTLK